MSRCPQKSASATAPLFYLLRVACARPETCNNICCVLHVLDRKHATTSVACCADVVQQHAQLQQSLLRVVCARVCNMQQHIESAH